MEEEVLRIDIEEIDNFVFTSLIERNYVPEEAEVQDISEIFVKLLLNLGIIDTIYEKEEFEEGF